MINVLTNSSIYQNSVSPSRRNGILLIYQDYVALVNKLKEDYNRYTIEKIAQNCRKKIFNNELYPWNISLATEDDIINYNDFINRRIVNRDNHNCYVSLKLTSPGVLKSREDIISYPEDYEIWKHYNTLPHHIERYTAVAQKGEKLSDVRFVIAGKYVATYNGNDNAEKLTDVLNSEDFKIKMNYMLDCLTRYPENLENITEQQNEKIKTEVLAAIELAPIESSILETLSLLADETHKIIKNLLEKRVGNRFLAQAEKEGIISSATVLQDYLNIRHLIHHQLDTLDHIGRFNDNELLKNEGVRQHFLDSYCNLCDRPLHERISKYIAASKYFAPLVELLNPQLIIQQEQESDIKFNNRIKEASAIFRKQPIYIQTKFILGKKKKNQIKKIKQQYPYAKIIDQIDKNSIDNLLENCRYRRRFSKIYQNIEYKINLYCLLSGKNYTPNLAWDYIRRHHLIPVGKIAKWDEYKRLRNALSHQYMDEEINQKLASMQQDFFEDSVQLEAVIDDLMPKVHLIKDDIYEARHQNGTIVTIDFNKRKVISIRNTRNNKQYQVTNNKEYTQKSKSFTEEYANGISITTTGTKVSSCKLNNGVEINFEKKQIEYADGTKVYITANGRFIVSPRNEKIITDENFKVLKYIIGNTEINIRKNENCRFNQTRHININNNNQIFEEYWDLPHTDKQHIRYCITDNGAVLKLNNNTELHIEKDNIRVFHKNKELTYVSRREFAESYNTDRNNAELMNIKQKDR